MKMKAVLAAVVAAATVSAVSVCGAAETAGNPETETPAPEAEAAAGNPDTGIEGVAAVTGAIVLAGALVAISRKKEHE